MVSKKIYVQGGVGAIADGERFGDNYELPNATAYNETCAAIANVYWNHRMFLLHGDAKYIDVLEKSIVQWPDLRCWYGWKILFLHQCDGDQGQLYA